MIKQETWSGVRGFPVAGHYLEIIQNVNPLKIVGYARDERVIFREDNAGSGFYIDRRGFIIGPDGNVIAPEGFNRFEIETQGNEAVTFFVTDATGGNKSVSSDVSDRAARLLGVISQAGQAFTPAKKTVGVASTQLLAANASRKYLAIQNPAAAANLFVHTAGGPAAADATCFKIAPGQTWEPPVPPTGAIFGWSDVGATDYHVIEA